MLERGEFGGLNTDDPPERLGRQAMRIENMVPAGKTGIRPRPGVEEMERYEPQKLGRLVCADGLPENLGNGVLIVCLNVTELDGNDTRAVNQQVDGLFAFYPSLLAYQYNFLSGANEELEIYGMIE